MLAVTVQAFPTPESVRRVAERAVERADQVMRHFVPDHPWEGCDTVLGTNCVVLRVPTAQGGMALRFEPVDGDESRDALVRSVVRDAPVARPLRGVDGSLSLAGPAGFRASCSPWVPGRPVTAHDVTPARIASAFGGLARLHRALDAVVRDPRWPARRPRQVYWSMAAVPAGDLPADATGVLESAVVEASRRLDDLPLDVCHGDAHAGNVLLSAGSPRFLDLDFCRVERGGRLLDFGVMLQRMVRGALGHRSDREVADLVRHAHAGYSSVLPGMEVRTALGLAAVESASKRRAIAGDHGDPADRTYWSEVGRRHTEFLSETAEILRIVGMRERPPREQYR